MSLDESTIDSIVTNHISIKQRLAQLKDEFPLDQAVIKALPPRSKLISIECFGQSAYTITGKLLAQLANEFERAYFLKVAYYEHGGIMLRGEWESTQDIHRLMPDFIPRPIGFGKYKDAAEDTYFYISEFVDMDVITPPDATDFTKRLADMHRLSTSPTNEFGYHVTTCDGKTAHIVAWEKSWAVFYKRLLLEVCRLDLETNGPWPELELATSQVVTKIIPRLLGALEQDGRGIKPSLIHGDLWEGNTGIKRATGETLLFDAGSYYAHNEMELGHWRCEFSDHFRDKVYIREYLRHCPAAEPVDEFEDRNRLYSLKGAINYSAGHPRSSLRKTAYNNMCYLCEKYAPNNGIDKYDPKIDPSITGARIVPHVVEGLV